MNRQKPAPASQGVVCPHRRNAIKYIAVYAISTRANADFSALMNSPAWNWLGWITQKPVTEDYVPLFPWLGVMLWGVAGGNWLLRAQPGWLAQVKASTSRTVGALAALGRWSLVYYLLHQPLMIGALTVFTSIFPAQR